ncbi:EAL domain-containing protein [Sphingomonas sp. MAH-20]|uniref:EAL domain-containing protein n=1 Tax=Sphingomonas horti TaxID=2682842 RepID=A0A6I4IXM3_9SPHN|nr:EAL domain-containing protein [Sphingomonas horti]MVO76718.1 EAL domain-containing protein [Sphingomonas horti]
MTGPFPHFRNNRVTDLRTIWSLSAVLLSVAALILDRTQILGVSALAVAAALGTGAGLAGLAAAGARSRRHAQVLYETNRQLRDLLHVDQLTGLMNRSAFDAALDDPRLAEHEMLIVLFFDLDRFKDVNDTLGHKAGDDLLRQVAQRAADAVGSTIALARLGGDEFASVIAWSADNRPERYGAAIVEAVGAPYLIDGHQVEIAASVGLALGDPTRFNPRELLRRADLAMYAAKGSPGGRFRVFDDALDRHQTRESSVRIELGKALIENQFSLHFQPLIDARTGAFSSAEALLRSQSPGLREVTPAALIATAETSGQINALTEWTIETALTAITKLQTSPIGVNISPVYFRKPEFVSRLMDKLLLARVRPELLTVEITESVLIENLDAARQSVDRLREIGMKVFLDDFGTGYSSLSYLQYFELDGLKLDKSFLRTVGDRRKTNQIIRSMIDFGHSLDMRVVVEGVESDWQVRLLQLLGCDLLQGYEIGMPMPLDELLVYRDLASGRQVVDGAVPPSAVAKIKVLPIHSA